MKRAASPNIPTITGEIKLLKKYHIQFPFKPNGKISSVLRAMKIVLATHRSIPASTRSLANKKLLWTKREDTHERDSENVWGISGRGKRKSRLSAHAIEQNNSISNNAIKYIDNGKDLIDRVVRKKLEH